MARPLVEVLASRLAAIENCEKSKNWEWLEKHKECLLRLTDEHMPSGSGFDAGTSLMESSTPECLVFHTAYHHMDGYGFYAGWTEHVVRVRPSFVYKLLITISGPDKDNVKDVIHEAFYNALTQLIEEDHS